MPVINSVMFNEVLKDVWLVIFHSIEADQLSMYFVPQFSHSLHNEMNSRDNMLLGGCVSISIHPSLCCLLPAIVFVT